MRLVELRLVELRLVEFSVLEEIFTFRPSLLAVLAGVSAVWLSFVRISSDVGFQVGAIRRFG